MKEIAEQTLPYEGGLFMWLNGHHSPFWDTFMATYSGKALWIPVAIVFLFTIFYKTKWKTAILFLGCLILLICLCDQISASVIKPLFTRFRPTHHPDFMNQVLVVNNYRGGRFGFISAHAANGFGVATFVALTFKYRWFTITLFAWALVTCYSRIYLGVHFITDVLGGMMLGSLLGFLIHLLFQYSRFKVLKLNINEMEAPAYPKLHAHIIIAAIITTVFLNILYSIFINYLIK